MTDPRVTKAAIEAAIETAEAVRLELAKALSTPPTGSDLLKLFARAGNLSAKMANILTAALAVIDRERPEPSDAVLEAMDRARDPEWWATLDANGGNLTPAGKVIAYGRITTMRRALAAQTTRTAELDDLCNNHLRATPSPADGALIERVKLLVRVFEGLGIGGSITYDRLDAEAIAKNLRALIALAESRPAASDWPDDAAYLEGYLAAAHWIEADSWDFCSECIEILRAATGADTDLHMSPEEIAAALKRLRARAGLATPLKSTPPPAQWPEGWKLCRREPTPDQIKAVALAFGAKTGELLAILTDVTESETLKVIVAACHAMWDVAPSPPQPQPSGNPGELQTQSAGNPGGLVDLEICDIGQYEQVGVADGDPEPVVEVVAPAPNRPAFTREAILAEIVHTTPAAENLTTHQRQLDMDGCEVAVSRQAIDETVDGYLHMADFIRSTPPSDALAELVAQASALKFGAYPAHGSGFVIVVTEGDIDAFKAALVAVEALGVRA